MLTAHPFRKALEENSAATSFAAKIPTTTKPEGDGVVDLFDSDLGLAINTFIPEWVQLIPYGSDAADETLNMRLWGWSKTVDGIWIPQLLALLAVTLGNIDATAIAADNFLADTIAVTEGSEDDSSSTDGTGGALADEISPADDSTASVLVQLRGCQLIEFDFDMVTAASANCLWRVMDEH